MMKLIIANWKMNFTKTQEIDDFFKVIKLGFNLFLSKKQTIGSTKLIDLPYHFNQARIIIAPPFVWLSYVKKILQELNDSIDNFNFILGAQDCFWEQKGSFTGEISPLMLKNIGCQYVILGHSERKSYLNETNRIVNQKIKAALMADLQPVVCFGIQERDLNKSKKEIISQVKETMQDIAPETLKRVIFVYEPVWAISDFSNQPCTGPEAQAGVLLLTEILKQIYPQFDFQTIKFLYGGSVNSNNVSLFLNESQIDGLLIGKASLNARQLIKIILS